jgi:hypothetical protein
MIKYYVNNVKDNEKSKKNKCKFIMIWKGDEYSTYIDDTYLEDKIITIDNLEEFFNSVFNKKKFYDINTYYDFYFCGKKSIQLNIKLETKINDNLKPLIQYYVFILHREDNKTWFNWFIDIILERYAF